MAFSTANVLSTSIGGQIRILTGTWSGSAGDAAGTVTFAGGYIGSFWFDTDSNSNQVFPAVNSSVSGSTTTLTVQNQDNVTNGTFIIFVTGN